MCNKAENSALCEGRGASAKSIALFGGTFDPIHIAHLELAKNIQLTFNFQRFLFLPCRLPTHKNNKITAPIHRIAMIEAALQEYSIKNAEICLDEINRSTPSYTVDTLKSIRQHYPYVALTFILGFDMFAILDTWHRYQDLLGLCNLLVLKRQDNTKLLPEAVNNLLTTHQTQDKFKLTTSSFGNIYIFDAGIYAISSTMIRQDVKSNLIKKLIPSAVAEYINKHKLYTYTQVTSKHI